VPNLALRLDQVKPANGRWCDGSHDLDLR